MSSQLKGIVQLASKREEGFCSLRDYKSVLHYRVHSPLREQRRGRSLEDFIPGMKGLTVLQIPPTH